MALSNSNTVQNRVRVAGAGFTLFTFGGQPITFCEQVAHTSPKSVAQFSAIQPMDEPHPIEILTSAAAGPGQLVLNLIELFGAGGRASKVWDRLGVQLGDFKAPFGTAGDTDSSPYLAANLNNGSFAAGRGAGAFAGAVDIVDVFLRQATLDPSQLNIMKIVRPLPTTTDAQAGQNMSYTEEYEGCKIVDIVDGEQVAVGTMEVIKQITVAYRFIRRNGGSGSGYGVRDRAIPDLSQQKFQPQL